MKTIETYRCLKINAPDWFSNSDFINWLNNKENIATWHTKGSYPNDFSDVFVWYDNHEGSDSDMPFWDELCKICDENEFLFGIIWITNT